MLQEVKASFKLSPEDIGQAKRSGRILEVRCFFSPNRFKMGFLPDAGSVIATEMEIAIASALAFWHRDWFGVRRCGCAAPVASACCR